MDMKILIVEDDPAIAGVVRSQVDAWGYEGAVVEDFQNVLEQFLQWKPQMVLLDISLPFYDGYYWCRKIREVSQVPVIFISSAADNMNVVMAVNMGADDFIAKPFDLQVLMAKIQAVMRRAYDFGNQIHWLEHKGAVLNTEDTSLHYRGERLELTKNETRILACLMKKGLCTKEELVEDLWQNSLYVDENTLYVNVNRLREKLKRAGAGEFIRTVRGVGYRL